MKIKILTLMQQAAYMQRLIRYLCVFLISHQCIAQEIPADSAKTLEQVTITAFEQTRKITQAPVSAAKIDLARADRTIKTSLVNVINTVAGVRMEERSPGSYRINIRGSSLRSPFGVRNVKVYWNDIPVTDPGGNTYFNQFAFNNFSSIEIYKGPVSSMYGAGTGGLILLRNFDQPRKSNLTAEFAKGSFNTQNFFFNGGLNNSAISFAHNESDGYRDHSAMRRTNASYVNQVKFSDRQQITSSVLYSDLYYQTPGGLTKAEFDANPKSARPAAGTQPSAGQAKAAIYQKNFLAGINHAYSFTENIKNSTSLYGAFAQIKNPTFRNYERRNEPHYGGRTTFSFQKKIQKTVLKAIVGGELQQGYFNTQVSKNNGGNPDTLQTNDDVRYNNYSVFAQGEADIANSLFVTGGASLNKADVEFQRLNKYPVLTQKRSYSSEWSPRIAIIKKITQDISLYASMTKGFSPPTVAELLPSTSVISTFLEAEEGTNYEIGAKAYLLRGELYLEAAAFYFKLHNALVVRKDATNADYYVNAGGAEQKGVEITADYKKSFSNSVVDYFIVNTAVTLNAFSYLNFQKENTNYAGKNLPGVPRGTLSAFADLMLRNGLNVHATWYGASRTFLNDANTVAAPGYKLLGARIGWRINLKKKTRINLYVVGENLLNEKYSLGNDINAAAGRYFNAAPARNYFGGVSVSM